MAGEITIRVRGDASQLRGFYRGVETQTEGFVTSMQGSFQKQFKDLLGLRTFNMTNSQGAIIRNAFGDPIKTGTTIRNIRTEIDAVNNVLKATGETGLLLNGRFMKIGETSIFRNFDVNKLTDINKRATDLMRTGQEITTRYSGLANTLQASLAPFQQQVRLTEAARDAADQLLRTRRAERTAITQDIQSLRQQVLLRQAAVAPGGALAGLRGAARTAYDAGTAALQAQIATRLNDRRVAQNAVNRATRDATTAQNAYTAALNDPAFAAYPGRLQKLQDRMTRLRATVGAQLRGVLGERRALFEDTNIAPPIGYLNLPPALQRKLQQQGLETTGAKLYAQNAQFNTPIQDLERNLTRFSGTYDRIIKIKNKDIAVTQQWNAAMDSSGRMVETVGRNLRGFSRMFEMIGRDFTKVIEWTVATTVVFGGLRVAMQGFGMIKTLDADLTRFSLTAGLSADRVRSFYTELRDVANETATPLEELIKAADDLALAVKKPGQSSRELTGEIKLLAEAIGIYTNLTGQDTVSSTDQLVAVMKQLGYTASGVYVVLNKVTAAAGGQSGSIADITKGLSVMAEAGKQAGLSVDQQIAVVKTLSQVTSKSPAEVATAFKNLVGALENPAAIKALEKLKINTIAQGNDIIGIYTEIASKIRSGAIGATEVSGLLRAISGGPRRAPDAAALLANINTVLKETRVSQNATNEAFIANAAIMDTLQAKFVVFQNTLKDKAFQQFGAAFKDFAIQGISVVTALLDAFSKVPSSVITTVMQFGIFIMGIKLGTKLLGLLGITGIDAFKGLISGARGATIAWGGFKEMLHQVRMEYIGLAQMGPTGGPLPVRGGLPGVGRAGRMLYRSGVGRYATAAGGGALAGAALGAVSGGGMPQIIGGGLQGLGLGLMMMPEGLITKVAGGIALVVGTIISLQNEEVKASKSSKELAQEILGVYQSAKGASETVGALEETQATYLTQIKELQAKDKLSIEDKNVLVQLQKDYTKTIMDTTVAQDELNASLVQLGQLVPGLKGTLAKRDWLNQDDLKATIDKFVQTILDVQYPGRVVNGKVPYLDLFGKGEGSAGRSVPQIPRYNINEEDYKGTLMRKEYVTRGTSGISSEPVEIPVTFDMRTLKDNQEALTAVMDQMATTGTVPFKMTTENLDLLSDAIDNLPAGELQDKYKNMTTVFKANNDALSAVVDTLDIYRAAVEGMKGADAGLGEKLGGQLTSIGSTLQAASKNLPEDQFKAVSERLLKNFADAFNNKTPLSDDFMKALATEYAQYDKSLGYANATADQQKAIVQAILEKWKLVNDEQREQAVLIENNAKAMEDFASMVDNLQSKYADRTAQAQADLQGGVINRKEFNSIVATSNEAISALNNLKAKMEEIAATNTIDLSLPLKDLGSSLQSYIRDLSKMNGLQDAGNLNAQQLTERLFGLADMFNLTGGEVKKLGRIMDDFFKALQIISQYKAQFKIFATMDVSQMIRSLEIIGGIQFRQIAPGVPVSIPVKVKNPYQAIINQLKRQQGILNSTSGQVKSLFAGSSGSSGSGSSGSSGGAGGGPDYGEIDLPEELRGVNRDSFIHQAIKNARELQKHIPGAAKEAKNDIVSILDGMKKLDTVKGVREDLLRRALEDLAAIEKKKLDMETKADTIRRIRVGAGDFAAIANVPVNSQTGVSMGGPNGPIGITLNLNGTVLTPAQFEAFANKIAAAIARQLGG